jgi:hypothetical protein
MSVIVLENDSTGPDNDSLDVPALLNKPYIGQDYIIVNMPNTRIAILSHTVPCQLTLRNAETGAKILTKSVIDSKPFPSFSPDGQYLIVSVEGHIEIFDALLPSDPEARLILPTTGLTDEGQIVALSVSSSCQRAAIALLGNREPISEVVLYSNTYFQSHTTWEPIDFVHIPFDRTTVMSYTTDGNILFVAVSGDGVTGFNIISGERIFVKEETHFCIRQSLGTLRLGDEECIVLNQKAENPDIEFPNQVRITDTYEVSDFILKKMSEQ